MMENFTLVLLSFITALSTYLLADLCMKRWKLVQMIDAIPGPRAIIPFLGNFRITFMPRERIPFQLAEWYQKYGSIFRVWVFFVHAVVVSKAQFAESIFNNGKHIEKSIFYRLMEPWLGSGLLTSDGRKWHSRRKMITPAFHFTILSDFVEVFVKNAEILVEKLETCEKMEEFEVSDIISANTLDNVCETAMGLSINAQMNYDGDYVRAINSVNQLILKRIPRAWLWCDFVFKYSPTGRKFYENLRIIHSFTTKVIQERRENFAATRDVAEDTNTDKGDRRKMAFLDLLLHASQNSETPLTDADLREEVDTFMFEGYDTTASALVWALFRLGTHQNCQERCAEELREIFEGSERAPSMKDLSRMKYLEQFIKEVLRHYPSVPFIGRKLGSDTLLGEYLIPSGTNVGIDIYHLHRDEEQFPNPDEFNPDHFSAENIRTRHPYAFIPFSAGPRNCIGQKFAYLQMKVTLSTILRNFIIETTMKPEDIRITFELILRFEPDIKIKIRKRDASL
nr:PREDICTED: cytochrome P450 4C1-like [Bemisia tabaci]